MSELVKGSMEEHDEDDEETVIPLPQVDSKTLDKVLAYCEHVKLQKNEPPTIEKPIRKEFNEIVDDWYYQYISWD